jgi:hypothetical protein
MMGKALVGAGLAAFLLGSQAQAQAVVVPPTAASRALGQCLVLKTTGADRLLIARWLAGAMGMGDATRSLVTIDAAQKALTDQSMGALFTRLFTNDCVEYAAPLAKAQDRVGIEAAGGMLGEIAMRELMSDPKVSAGLFAYMKHVDAAKLAELAK